MTSLTILTFAVEGEGRLVKFLTDSSQYRPERLIGLLKSDEFPRTRAVLLGTLGNHEGALQIYVYKLQDYDEAEAYCSKVYQTDPDPHGIFLTLLRLYLDPASPHKPMLAPALALISRHGTRLDASSTIDLLPANITMQEVHHFMVRTLRDAYSRANRERVGKELLASGNSQVDWAMAKLQQRRVKITDMRL